MRFMVMHKMTPEMEQGAPPDPEVMAKIDQLVADGAKENVFVSGEGLKPTSERVHIAYKDGKRTVTDGPFTEAKELVAGFALMRVKSKEEAIYWCDRFASAIGDVELFMGPVVEPWELGIMPKPENPPLRFLSMHKLDENQPQCDGPPDPKLMAAMGALIHEMTEAGVMEATGGLSGTRHGARIRYDGGKPRVIDGPFAESKELIAGYAILEVPSKAIAIEWALRFGDIVRVKEIDVRPFSEY
ncbi:MAG TPA: YciI family protein [Polyangiales bacterium]|nr:YciI family protein [Polyangiales bacterium]